MATRTRKLLRTWLAIAALAGALVLAVIFWPDPGPFAPPPPRASAGPALPPAHPPPPAVRNPAAHRVSRPPAATAAPPNVLEQIAVLHRGLSSLEVTAALQRNAEETARTVEQFCARAEALKRNPASAPLLQPPSAGADAGPFLAPLVDWLMGPEQVREGKLHLPQALVDRVSAAKKDWPFAFSRADTGGLDFGWMRQLHAFDHWSVASAGPIAELQEQADFSYVAPSYFQLLAWVKLRYVDALGPGGDLAAAAEDARHLSDLVRSNEGYVATALAGRMLRSLNEVQDAAAARGVTLPPLPAMDASAISEVSQLTRAGRRYFWPGVSPEVTRRAFECSPLPCAHVLEGAYARRALSPYSPGNGEAELWDLASMGNGCDGLLLQMLAGSAPAGPADALGLVQLLSAP